MDRFLLLVVGGISLALLNGCGTSVEPLTPAHGKLQYPHDELAALATRAANDLCNRLATSQNRCPALIFISIRNESGTSVNIEKLTKQLATQLRKGKVRLLDHRSPSAKVPDVEELASLGKGAGADYIITGFLVAYDSKYGRTSKGLKRDVARYRLVLEAVDCDSSLVATRVRTP